MTSQCAHIIFGVFFLLHGLNAVDAARFATEVRASAEQVQRAGGGRGGEGAQLRTAIKHSKRNVYLLDYSKI